MKQLHSFDEVFDSQKVFRKLLDAMANPGRRCCIKAQADKLFGDEPQLLAVAMTLLDTGVSFCAPDNAELTEQVMLLTHAKPEKIEDADYLFISSGEMIEKIVESAKRGTLEDPHKSATLILKTGGEKGGCKAMISGPGVKEKIEIDVPADVVRAVKARDRQEYEYPQGIDFIFVLPEGDVLCLPRLVRMEEC